MGFVTFPSVDSSLLADFVPSSFLLVRHPHVLEKLRSEIAAQGNVEWTRSGLRNMKYLQNILKESR